MIHRLRIVRNIRLGVKDLMLHAMRSVLTMLGVILGVGSVIAMLAIGEGASREALERLRKLGSNNILVNSQKPVQQLSGAGGSSSSKSVSLSVYGLLYDDEARIRQTIPHVRRTVPAKTVRKEGSLGDRAIELRVVGTTNDWFDLVKRPLIAGRVLTARDLEEFGNVVVLTESGARKLLATAAAIGQPIRIGSDYYEVVGIVDNGGSGSEKATPDSDHDAYIPINLARERFTDVDVRRSSGSFERERVELHQLIVEVDSTDHVPQVARAVDTILNRFHANSDYQLIVPLDLLREAERTKRIFNWVLGSIAAISLVVGGIGIMNIMLASVTERTREIGIRRAIGARRTQIVMQFLIETVVLSTLGGIIGVGIGILFPAIVTYTSGMPTQVTTWSLILSVGISMMVGILFGIYPAIRAAMLDPIVALRHE